MADRRLLVGCKTFIGVEFGGEVRNDEGAKGKSVPKRMWPFSAKALRLGNAAGLDDSAVSK
jgi:hypothetical protein